MFDSSVGAKSDSHKKCSASEAAVAGCDWNELDKKATKASDDDVKSLTQSLQSSWADVTTLTKVACMETTAQSKSTLEKLASLGPIKVDAALKMAYKIGEVGISTVKQKIGSLGAELMSWAYGDKKSAPEQKVAEAKPAPERGKEAKPEAKPAPEQAHKAGAEKPEKADAAPTAASVLKDMAPETLKQIWNTVFSDGSPATGLAILPAAAVRPDAIIFGVIAGLANSTFSNEKTASATPSDRSNAEKDKTTSSAARPPAAAPPVEAQTGPEKKVSEQKPVETSATTNDTTRRPEAPAAQPDAKPGEQAPEVKVEDGKVTYLDKSKSVRVERKPDGTISAFVDAKDRAAEIFAGTDGTRVYKENGKNVYKFIDVNQFLAGEFASDGQTITQTQAGQKVLIATKEEVAEYFENMVFFADRKAETAEQALANYRAKHPNEAQSDNALMIWFKGGAALVHPSLQKILEFRRCEDGIELRYDLGDGKQLRRSPKGKLFIVSDNGETVKELSDEQKKQLVAGLGAQAEVIRHLLDAMESGQPIALPDGHEISIDDARQEVRQRVPKKPNQNGEPQKPTEVILTMDGAKIEDSTRKVSFDDKTGKLVTQNANEDTPTTIDLNSDKFDMVTKDFVRKDGAVTFTNSGVKIEADGAVALPGGTQISANNDIHFSNGSVLYRDGTMIAKDGTVINTVLNVPAKANLDSFVSQAISMASSIASRVHSGSCTMADIAIIEANMSVVQNFINLFSIIGNLPMANSLYRSWAILKDSHGRAQREQAQPTIEERTQEEQVRSFLQNLSLEAKKNYSQRR